MSEVINPMDLSGLNKLVPNVDWQAVLAGVGLGDRQQFIVNETTAIRDGAKLLDSEPLAAWKAYMAFHFVNSYSTDLPKAFDTAQFDFNIKALRGVETAARSLEARHHAGRREPRRRARPDLRAQALSARHQGQDGRAGRNLRRGVKERLATLAWMDDATRAEALKKLDAFEPRIGYPDKWRDYSALSIERGKHFENARNVPAVRMGTAGSAHQRARRSQTNGS